MLVENKSTMPKRVNELLTNGYPAYTTQIGWMGYTNDRIRKLCKEYLAKGFTAFKLKVGQDLKSDKFRCNLVREEIGWDNHLVI